MELVALLSSGKGTWSQVSGLIKQGEWERIILLGDDFAKDNFSIPASNSNSKPYIEFIKIQLNQRHSSPAS